MLTALIGLTHAHSLGRQEFRSRQVQDLSTGQSSTGLWVSGQSDTSSFQTGDFFTGIRQDSGRDLGLLPTHPDSLSCGGKY